jgi:hypothetical protein
MRGAPPAATLIEENDVVVLGVEVKAAFAGAPGSWPPVNHERRLPVRIAAGLPVDNVAVAHVEHSFVVRLNVRVQVGHGLYLGSLRLPPEQPRTTVRRSLRGERWPLSRDVGNNLTRRGATRLVLDDRRQRTLSMISMSSSNL